MALVGYTYVLEQMGIRFLKQAGTSAGAINTALMTVIGNKQDVKSPQVLQAICDLDFFSLVDGHPVARWIIRRFITDGDFMKKVKLRLTLLGGFLIFLLACDLVLIGLSHVYPALAFWTGFSFVLTGTVSYSYYTARSQ